MLCQLSYRGATWENKTAKVCVGTRTPRPCPNNRTPRCPGWWAGGGTWDRSCYAGVSSDRTNLSPFTKDYRGLALPCELRLFAARKGAMKINLNSSGSAVLRSGKRCGVRGSIQRILFFFSSLPRLAKLDPRGRSLLFIFYSLGGPWALSGLYFSHHHHHRSNLKGDQYLNSIRKS